MKLTLITAATFLFFIQLEYPAKCISEFGRRTRVRYVKDVSGTNFVRITESSYYNPLVGSCVVSVGSFCSVTGSSFDLTRSSYSLAEVTSLISSNQAYINELDADWEWNL